MKVSPTARYGLRTVALLYLFVLLVVPVALIFWRQVGRQILFWWEEGRQKHDYLEPQKEEEKPRSRLLARFSDDIGCA